MSSYTDQQVGGHPFAYSEIETEAYLRKEKWSLHFNALDEPPSDPDEFIVTDIGGDSFGWTIDVPFAGSSAGQQRTAFLYPILTAPLAGKTAASIRCPLSHVDALKNMITDAEKVLIVGCSGLDADLLELLADTPHSPRLVHMVDKVEDGEDGEQSAAAWIRFAEAVPPYHSAENRLETSGFADCLSTEAFKDFLEA